MYKQSTYSHLYLNTINISLFIILCYLGCILVLEHGGDSIFQHIIDSQEVDLYRWRHCHCQQKSRRFHPWLVSNDKKVRRSTFDWHGVATPNFIPLPAPLRVSQNWNWPCVQLWHMAAGSNTFAVSVVEWRHMSSAGARWLATDVAVFLGHHHYHTSCYTQTSQTSRYIHSLLVHPRHQLHQLQPQPTSTDHIIIVTVGYELTQVNYNYNSPVVIQCNVIMLTQSIWITSVI